jgi:hypothetical protein
LEQAVDPAKSNVSPRTANAVRQSKGIGALPLIWLFRTMLGGAALAGAWYSWHDAAVVYWAGVAPEAAPRPIRSDPRVILAATNWDLVSGAADHPTAQRISDAAKAVLRDDPLNVVAIRQLGLAEIALGQGDGVRKLQLAERISRSDAPTQIALLNHAERLGDFAAQFDHINRLLTAYPGTRSEIFAQWLPRLADPRFHHALAGNGQRPWFLPFIEYAVGSQADPYQLAALLQQSRITVDQAHAGLLARILDELLKRGDFEEAVRTATASTGIDRPRLSRFGFLVDTFDPRLGALVWRLVNDDVVQTAYVGDGALQIDAQPDRPAIVMTRITQLPAGEYLLEQRVSSSSPYAGQPLQWRVACRNVGASGPSAWGAADIVEDRRADGVHVQIPENCGAQRWELHLLPAESQTELEFRLSGLTLRRTR